MENENECVKNEYVVSGVAIIGGSSPQECPTAGTGGRGPACFVPDDASKKGGSGGHEVVVDDPDHYRHSTFEVIDEMVLAFGIDATITFCVLNAWKYRARAPYKGKLEQDMEKADRYMQYAHDLQLIKAKQCGEFGIAKLPLLKSSGRKMVSQQSDGQVDASHKASPRKG